MSKSRTSSAPIHLRVFLSSPGDVATERTIAREVVEALPKDAAFKGKVTIEVVSWDDPDAPTPMYAGLTPQQAVDRGLKPSGCELTIVIFWGRMGTPLAEPKKADGTAYLSGTEYEFEDARAAKRPILVYRRTSPVPITLDVTLEQFEEKKKQQALVEAFFTLFTSADGTLTAGYHHYQDPDDFRQQFTAHLKKFVVDVSAERGAKKPRAPKGPKPVSGKEPATVPAAYLCWLQARCASIELLGLRLKQGQAVRLSNVYVPLTTASLSERDRLMGKTWTFHRELEQLLLDRVGASSAYLTGDPGTGKSTFCRWIAWLVCENAVPTADVETPEGYRERLPAALAGRLPVYVPLREFWSRLTERPKGRTLSRFDLEVAVAGWLIEKSAPGVTETLVAANAAQGTALLIFDGIDEVPTTHRVALVDALVDACGEWMRRGNRVVVTGRPYGLSESDVRRLGLPHATIRPIPEELQHLLVRRWFRILDDSPEAADAKATTMLRQVAEQTWLSPLTANPLLLTGMCIVFGDGKGLPEDKYELYDRVADSVLYNRIPDKTRQRLVRGRLAVVAYGMHIGEGLGEERSTPQAEVTDGEIERMLRDYQERSAWAEQDAQEVGDAREELVTQTGLLLPSGEHKAQFLHLSFQDFLAAQRVADVDGERLLDVFLRRSATPEWRNTLSFLFGSVLASSTTPERGVRLLTQMIDRLESASVGLTLTAADAAEILTRRRVRLATEAEDRLRDTCLHAMRGSAPARDRAATGTALGRLGDPRFAADRWYLPDDEMLGFVEIPAGPFTMGSDKAADRQAHDEAPQHEVTLTAYYIARWPVTVAQFKAFVEDPDNGNFRVTYDDSVRGIPNHPVVTVSWREALEYCRWLTAKLAASERTPPVLRDLLSGTTGDPWRVTLASEEEWEKAARGTDGRIYPWGPTVDTNRANYRGTGLGRPNAVGCFPDGRSPYGIEELSGNVLEWTRSLLRNDRYEPGDEPQGRKNATADDRISRLVKGGGFDLDEWTARAAYRLWLPPDSVNALVGFRLVVSPFCSGL